MKAYASAGLKFPVITGETGGDDALLKSFGDEALGLISCIPYTLDLETDEQQALHRRHAEEFRHRAGPVCRPALRQLPGGGSRHSRRSAATSSDKSKLIAAMRAVKLTDTPRGPVKFDHFGNVIGDFYIRKLGKEGAKYGLKLWNKTIKTYKDVSQFWTYDEKKFLEQPVYSRDYPPLKG